MNATSILSFLLDEPGAKTVGELLNQRQRQSNWGHEVAEIAVILISEDKLSLAAAVTAALGH